MVHSERSRQKHPRRFRRTSKGIPVYYLLSISCEWKLHIDYSPAYKESLSLFCLGRGLFPLQSGLRNEWRTKEVQLPLYPMQTSTAAQSIFIKKDPHTHGISLTHRHSSLNWPDPLCEPEHDCFSLLSSIVAFKYANQYLQLTLANHSVSSSPRGCGFSV